jgi:hypothetical protein
MLGNNYFCAVSFVRDLKELKTILKELWKIKKEN